MNSYENVLLEQSVNNIVNTTMYIRLKIECILKFDKNNIFVSSLLTKLDNCDN